MNNLDSKQQANEGDWLEDGKKRSTISSAARPPQILAPAGGRPQFMAALNTGADAVYLGLKAFNARARAENFSIADLHELVPLAHRHGMQVLVTLNVLIKDAELPDLIDTLTELESTNIDAIIVQDFAIAELCNHYFSGLRMHASTQMAVHNVYGVREAARLGMRRVVLARETTTVELQRIFRATSDLGVEIETFCHGSLCYSYSGLCFFSGAKDARSGNRGECAYTCRKPYKILSEPGHGFLFSMKDLDTSAELDKLVRAGVHTLKIEGRKKDAQYVASVVRLYRKKLNDLFGYTTGRRPLQDQSAAITETAIRKDLDYSFQRERTSFFLKGRYRENGIDLQSPTHQGVMIGEVLRCTNGRALVRTQEPLDLYDGIRLDAADDSLDAQAAKYRNDVVQFSLRSMYVKRKSVKTVAAGILVEIVVPDKFSFKQGDRIFKMRSSRLKEKTIALTKPPKDHKSRSKKVVDLRIEAGFDQPEACLKFTFSLPAEHGATLLMEDVIGVPIELARLGGSLAENLVAQFGVLGDSGLVCDVSVFGTDGYFVAPKLLKSVKRALQERVVAAYRQFSLDKALLIKSSLVASPSQARRPLGTVFKVDRLSTLKYIKEWLAEYPGDISVAEVIFEPKRAFFPKDSPEEVMQQLLASCTKLGAKLRFAVPTLVRGWDEPFLKRWVDAFKQIGSLYEVGNLGGCDVLRRWAADSAPHDVAADFTLYSLNSQAMHLLAAKGLSTLTFSIEDDRENISSLLKKAPANAKLQLIVYKDTPLFIAEACSLTALHDGCPSSKVCGYRTLEVANEDSEVFYVAHENCKSVVYGKEPFSLIGDKAIGELGVELLRLDFLTRPYDRLAVSSVLEHLAKQKVMTGCHSANFNRRLL